MRAFRPTANPTSQRVLVIVGAVVGAFIVGGMGVIAQSRFHHPPEKQAIIDRIAAEQATVVAKVPRDVELRGTPVWNPPRVATATPPPLPPDGIVREKQTIFDGRAMIENSWRGTINGVLFIVSAGHERGQPQKGFVGIHTLSADGRTKEALGYSTPTDGGAIRIQGVIGSRLTLVATEDGSIVVFDLLSRAFISGPGVIATGTPAARPPGAPTPTPTPPLAPTPTPTPPPRRP